MKLLQLANATVFVIVESAVMKSFVEGLGTFLNGTWWWYEIYPAVGTRL
jgi:hypothetical protein